MWGSVELEPEVRDWFNALGGTDADRVRFHIDRLAEMGPLLDEPALANWTASYASFGSSWQAVQHGSCTGSPPDDGSSFSRCS